MARGIYLGAALACAALAWPGSASEERATHTARVERATHAARVERATDAARELVAALRALARERAEGGRMELRASCEAGGEGAVHVVIDFDGGARTEILDQPPRDEPPVAQQGQDAPAALPATAVQPPSARRALEEALAGISALGEEAQQVRLRSLSSDAREQAADVRVKLELELLAPSQEQALALYARLRERWRESDALRELGEAPSRPLEQESGVVVEGLSLSYEFAAEPLGEPAKPDRSLELLVRSAGDGRGIQIGDLTLSPRVNYPRSGLVDRVLRVEPSDERTYPLDAPRRFFDRLEAAANALTVTRIELERTDGDRWRFHAEVTRRERAD